MDDQNVLVERIHAVYPDLAIETAQMNRQGWSNDVLVVNEQLIFRFPRTIEGVRTLDVEVAILRGIKGSTTLPVPDPIYYDPSPQAVGQVFMGYPMLPGEPLWRERFSTIEDAVTLDGLAQQLGAFLQELHRVPIQQVIAADLQLVSWGREGWTSLYTRIQEVLFPHLQPEAQQGIAQRFKSFLDDPHNFSFRPVLAHGDFATSNILVDGEPMRVSGVIDFGRTGLGDPAEDVAGLLWAYGEDFVQRCLPAYPEVESALDRARFYVWTFPLQTALADAERGDVEHLKQQLTADR